MSMLTEWYAQYQAKNPEVFNENFIFNRNKEENMKSILESIAMALESIPNIKFTGCEIEEDESKFTDLHKIEESRLIQATLSFHIECIDSATGELEKQDVSIKLLLPKLIDNFYYKLNGVRYYAIYQMIDKGTFNINNGYSLGLKTMLMPFMLNRNDIEIIDLEGEVHKGRLMELDVFRRKVNILLYFISECGFEETLQFFGHHESVRLSDRPESDEDEVGFELRKKMLYLHVKSDFLESDNWFVSSLVHLFIKSKCSSIEEASQPDFWNYILGRIYTPNKDQAIKKAYKIHCSVRRILDKCTVENMVHVAPRDKLSIYHIFRWMLIFFDQLSREDNMDLKNKRLRLFEYILYPLTKKLSTETYRCLNTKKLTMKTLLSIFSNIKPNLCIRQLITSELLRYVNCVNCLDLFSSAMKITQSGPQGLSSTNVQTRYRGLHPSYIGKVGLHAASAGDPGMVLTMTPFAQLDGLFFDKSIQYITDESLPDEIHLLEF